MVANLPQPPQRGNGSSHPSSEGSFAIYGIESVELQTRAKIYGNPTIDTQEPGTSSNPPPTNDLHIKRPTADPVSRPPKGTLRRMTHNTSARAAQNYNIVEDLVQAPLAMFSLEVLQTCPAQRKALLLVIGRIDPQDSTLAIFDMEKAKPRLSHQFAFQVQVVSKGRPIHFTVIDEGASTCVMSQACWLNLGSPILTPPSTSLKAFDGNTFLPKGYLASFPITLGGKTVTVDVEVIELHLDYNLLLGCSWSYAMTAIVSSVF